MKRTRIIRTGSKSIDENVHNCGIGLGKVWTAVTDYFVIVSSRIAAGLMR